MIQDGKSIRGIVFRRDTIECIQYHAEISTVWPIITVSVNMLDYYPYHDLIADLRDRHV